MTAFTYQDPTLQAPAPQPGLASRIGSGIVNAGKDAFNTLIGTPAVRLGQAIGTPIAKALGASDQGIANASNQDTNIPVLGGMNVPAQKAFGQGGGEQVVGQGLKFASYLIPGGEAEGVASSGFKSGLVQGAKLGGISGGLNAAGGAMQQGANASDVLSSGLRGVGTGAALGGPIGGITGAVGGLFTDNPIFKPGGGYQASVDTATQANDLAGQQAVGAANELSGTMTDIKTGLGNQFAEAPKTIEATDPTARLVLSSDSVDALNKLKNTASFQLPETLRLGGKQGVGYTPNSLSDIKDLYNLTPTDTQDLLSRLNELTFKSRASGDLAVNQQTVDLTRALKNQAQDSFGHITDSQGNSVWGRAYQDYQQGTNALNAMGDIVHIPKSPGEMPSPTDINKSMTQILNLQKTPQGRAILQQSVKQFKDVTGYDLTNPVATINKLLETQGNLETAVKGSHAHQVMEALKSPRLEARHIFTLAMALLGVTVGLTTFRKKIGGWLSGQ